MFEGTAINYAKYRPGFPESAVEFLNNFVEPDPRKQLLDAGTGTGQIISLLAPYFDDIVGVDPELEMLEVAADLLRPIVYERKLIRLFCSKIEDFTPPERFHPHLTVFSRSFHWTAQELTLRRLASFAAPHSAVALTSDRSFWQEPNDWQKAVIDLAATYLPVPQKLYQPGREWSEVLRESPFSTVEKASFPVFRQWTVEAIAGYLYSTSYFSHVKLGGKISEFEEKLERLLVEYSSNNCFIEENEWEVLVGVKRR